jgi:hypothetical protein
MKSPRVHQVRRAFARAVELTVASVFVLSFSWVLGPAFARAASTPTAAEPDAPAIEFWVIEPNEGQSSGGHAGIRVGEWVYHVEHRGDGLIADRRTPRSRFEESYRLRDNRGIDVIPLALPKSRAARLVGDLERRYFSRKMRLDRLDALQAEARWLSSARKRGAFDVELPGLGLYSTTGSPACSPETAARHRLFRASVERQHGQGWLARRRRQAKRNTSSLLARRFVGRSAAERNGTPTHTDRENRPTRVANRTTVSAEGHGGAHRRLIEAAQTWAAFEILNECRPVLNKRLEIAGDPTELPGHSGPAPTNTGISSDLASTRQVEGWIQTRDELSARLVTLVASERPDIGLSLLLAWARLEALERSIKTGQLHVVEPRRSEHQVLKSLAAHLPREWLETHRKFVRAKWQRARRDFESGSGPLEVRLASLERGHHAYQHLRADTLHPALEMPGSLEHVPSLSASVAIHYAPGKWLLPWPADVPASALEEAHQNSIHLTTQARREIKHDLAYRLLTQNCVTELLSLLEPPIAGQASPGASTSSAAPPYALPSILTGRFIPSVAGQFIENTLASGPRHSLPSGRRKRLQEPESAGTWHALREATTLTSKTYQPHEGDSSFLFFADGPIWLRPAIGLANLGYGLGAIGVGIMTIPFDHGERVRRGLEGMVMSVPELFLFQIRRGTYLETDPREAVYDLPPGVD